MGRNKKDFDYEAANEPDMSRVNADVPNRTVPKEVREKIAADVAKMFGKK